MLNTLRSVIDDDAKWFADIHDFYQAFKYKNIMTEDVVAWWNKRTGMELTPFFDAYLRHKEIPTLELKVDEAAQLISYKWSTDEPGFAMPIRIGDPKNWALVNPVTTVWKNIPFRSAWLGDTGVTVDESSYYVRVEKSDGHIYGVMDTKGAASRLRGTNNEASGSKP